jgi:hypothetical protein
LRAFTTFTSVHVIIIFISSTLVEFVEGLFLGCDSCNFGGFFLDALLFLDGSLFALSSNEVFVILGIFDLHTGIGVNVHCHSEDQFQVLEGKSIFGGSRSVFDVVNVT